MLRYYNNELIYFRDASTEFAQEHPKIAARLGLKKDEIKDPYVERLIESFCFLSARMQLKIDAEYPVFTKNLLNIIFPNYTSPIPAMSVAKFAPDTQHSNILQGTKIKKGTTLSSHSIPNESSLCTFTTTTDLHIAPIELTDAQIVDIPPDIDFSYFNNQNSIKSALRLSLEITDDNSLFSDLRNIDTLPIYLNGNETIASILHEFILTKTIGICIKDSKGYQHILKPYQMNDFAITEEESFLPMSWNQSFGHSLFLSYFSNYSIFLFIKLEKIAQYLKDIDDNKIEIILLLNEKPNEILKDLKPVHLELFCTPIVNIFQAQADQIIVNPKETEFHILVDKTQPLNYEVYSIEKVFASEINGNKMTEYKPLYHTVNENHGNYSRYFAHERYPRVASENMRKYGSRSAYIGSEVYISLVDQFNAPYSLTSSTLNISVKATNRDLPLLIPRNSENDLSCTQDYPVTQIGIIKPISTPYVPIANHNLSWELIRLLSFNYLPLLNQDGKENAKIIRNVLILFAKQIKPETSNQIQALVSVDITPTTKRLPGHGPLVYGRGMNIKLTFDERGFSGKSPYVLALIIKEWFKRHVSINSFIQVELHSLQKNLIHQWSVDYGKKRTI